MLKFVVGLTDEIDYDGFIYSQNDPQEVSYNIRIPTTTIEQATIEWQIDTSLAMSNYAIHIWENIIRTPHLCMITMRSFDYPLYPIYKEYMVGVSFINLLPMSNELKKYMTNDDYELCNGNPSFGDLCISMNELYDTIEPYNANIIGAYDNNDISLLPPATTSGQILPKFQIQFPLHGNAPPHSWTRDRKFVEFVESNKTEIERKGYDINSNRIKNYGPIVIGKLISDPVKTYENLTKYHRICRTSFVQTEE